MSHPLSSPTFNFALRKPGLCMEFIMSLNKIACVFIQRRHAKWHRTSVTDEIHKQPRGLALGSRNTDRFCFHHFGSYQFPLQRVDLLHHPRVQLDGIGDVGQHLLVGVGRLLVEQDPHSLAGLDAAPHHCHQLWPDEVLELAALLDPSFVAAPQGGRPAGGYGWGLDVDGPVGVDVFGVVQLFVGFDGAADVAFTCRWGKKSKRTTFYLILELNLLSLSYFFIFYISRFVTHCALCILLVWSCFPLSVPRLSPVTICQSCPWLFSFTFFHPLV